MTSITISTEKQTAPAGYAIDTARVPASEPAGSSSSRTTTASRRATTPDAVDTVSLRNVDKQQVEKHPEALRNTTVENQVKAVSDILFSYNTKGELRIKFMDSSNTLVYQTPPEFLSRVSDLLVNSYSSVTTKA